ncbi:MAG: DUF4118 domain-containing protein [Armatimonadota bacterium]
MFDVMSSKSKKREYEIKPIGLEHLLPIWARYALTLCIEAALTLILLYLLPFFPIAKFPILYVITIMLVAYLFGEGPAIMAFVVGAFTYDYFFVAPVRTLWPMGIDMNGITSMTAFLLGTSIVGFATLQMRNSNKKIRSLLLKVENELSERKQAEYALIQSEESYKQLAESAELSRSQMEAVINSMNQGVLILDPHGIIVNMNPSAMNLFRVSKLDDKNNRIDLLTRRYNTYYPDGSTAPSITEFKEKILDGEKVDNLILQIENRITGNSWFASVNTSAVLDKYGKIALIVVIVGDITERITNEQREKEVERQKLEFYRRTILAATNGKLVITDDADINEIAGSPNKTWRIDSAADIGEIRHSMMNLVKSYEMERNRLEKFIIAVGEVTTNTFKHAKSGKASIHLTPHSMIYMVSDTGPGIDALNLPDVALRDRFSTVGTLGMGYKVMLSFCDKVYLSTSPKGTTVAIEMRYQSLDSIFDSETSGLQCLS